MEEASSEQRSIKNEAEGPGTKLKRKGFEIEVFTEATEEAKEPMKKKEKK